MNTSADKTQEHKTQSVSAASTQMKKEDTSPFQLVDNRPKNTTQIQLREMAHNTSQNKHSAQYQPEVTLKTSAINRAWNEAPIQGVFTVAVNPAESSGGIVIESIQVGERPSTEHGSTQLNHSVPWSAVLTELSGKITGKSPEEAYKAVVVLASNKGLNVSTCPDPKDIENSAMKIARVKNVIETYLTQYNAQPGITHEDTATFTKSSSARYAPHNAKKLHQHESGPSSSTLSESQVIKLVHKVIQQTVTAADPGKTQSTEQWAIEAAHTFAKTSCFYLTGTGVHDHLDFILNMVARDAIEKMSLPSLTHGVFMKTYMAETTKLLREDGWKID